jgi:hypothetical protein
MALLLVFSSLFSPSHRCDASTATLPTRSTHFLSSSSSSLQSKKASSSIFQPTSSQQRRVSWMLARRIIIKRTCTMESQALATIGLVAHRENNNNNNNGRSNGEGKLFNDLSTSETTTTTTITWQEEFPMETKRRLQQQQAAPSRKSSSNLRNNLTFWRRILPKKEEHHHRIDTTSSSSASSTADISTTGAAMEPHALRTDLWQVTMHWKRKRVKDLFFSSVLPGKQQENMTKLQFSHNGYVRRVLQDENDNDNNDEKHHEQSRTAFNILKGKDSCDEDNDDDLVLLDSSLSTVGTWELSSTGLSWTLPLLYDSNDDDDNKKENDEQVKNAVLSFHGDFHFNPFGRQPKVLRGVVLLSNDDTPFGKKKTTTSWFRPVVATFHAVGIGQDTADLSYQDRPRRF